MLDTRGAQYMAAAQTDNEIGPSPSRSLPFPWKAVGVDMAGEWNLPLSEREEISTNPYIGFAMGRILI